MINPRGQFYSEPPPPRKPVSRLLFFFQVAFFSSRHRIKQCIYVLWNVKIKIYTDTRLTLRINSVKFESLSAERFLTMKQKNPVARHTSWTEKKERSCSTTPRYETSINIKFVKKKSAASAFRQIAYFVGPRKQPGLIFNITAVYIYN